MSTAKVSVIIPVYKAEETIRRCLNSVASQSYQNIEIIVIVDGNYDDSYNICKEYEKTDRRFNAVLKENGGVSSARNAGLRIATGKYIMFCDADDVMLITMIEKMVNVMECCDVQMAVCARKDIFDYGGRTINLKCCSIISPEECKTRIIADERFSGSVWNRIFIRDLLRDLYFDEDISFWRISYLR